MNKIIYYLDKIYASGGTKLYFYIILGGVAFILILMFLLALLKPKNKKEEQNAEVKEQEANTEVKKPVVNTEVKAPSMEVKKPVVNTEVKAPSMEVKEQVVNTELKEEPVKEEFVLTDQTLVKEEPKKEEPVLTEPALEKKPDLKPASQYSSVYLDKKEIPVASETEVTNEEIKAEPEFDLSYLEPAPKMDLSHPEPEVKSEPEVKVEPEFDLSYLEPKTSEEKVNAFNINLEKVEPKITEPLEEDFVLPALKHTVQVENHYKKDELNEVSKENNKITGFDYKEENKSFDIHFDESLKEEEVTLPPTLDEFLPNLKEEESFGVKASDLNEPLNEKVVLSADDIKAKLSKLSNEVKEETDNTLDDLLNQLGAGK